MAGVTTLLGGILGLGGSGTVWYVGTSVPGGTLGKPGDLYLRSTTGDVYAKGTGGTWTIEANLLPVVPYDVSAFVAGQPDGTGVVVCAFKAVRSFTLLAADGVLAAAATADATWELRKNGVAVVELHWANGSTAMTVVGSFGTGVAVAAGQVISIVTTVGATQPADAAVTLKGVLP